ncbi:Alpha-pyrone synthesis polyketide synthase-like Pks18 [Gimesia chilikensis]|uniref:Alpha-pyrone synthesis polyketide synthase-like Pks18 n=1 Tax=Gimesia chilikensis TaxID=2605989 RepID=A0A517W9F4_9PLAN|nr:type III polyketide synthase [Gimesia chilikensis]QDU01887.1 Alpha-pyrone synthesis polyketide synthase-like Pks18 [Gimesia chilikensis]
MSFEILGIGTVNPVHSIEQIEAATHAEALSCSAESTEQQRRLLPILYRRAGVKTRHSVVLESSTNGEMAQQSFYPPAESESDQGPTTSQRMHAYESNAASLAVSAVEAALQDSQVAPGEITQLITVSCSGFSAPGFDIALVRELGLPADVARTHVGFMGCHGALNGLRIAKAFTDNDPQARVLVCAVELCSLHQQYGWCPDKIVANALFADGAAAVVGKQASREPADLWQLIASGSTIVPDSEEMMSWRIGDNGFEMTLSPRIPDLIHQNLRPWLKQWLLQQGMHIEDVGSWAIHPGGPRILSAVAETVGFEESLLSPSREVLARYGNMSSPTVLFILKKLQAEQARLPCVMLGFGPGLTIEAALINDCDLSQV